MKISTLSRILNDLNHAGVKYLVVGGVAVNLHGYQRMTADLDIVIQLDSVNVSKAIAVFEHLSYRPTTPVEISEFADAEKRHIWKKEKNMTVFQLWSEHYKDTSIDIFIDEPFDFNETYLQSENVDLGDDLSIQLLSTKDLIDMKRNAGRPRDLDDIEHLIRISNEKSGQ